MKKLIHGKVNLKLNNAVLIFSACNKREATIHRSRKLLTFKSIDLQLYVTQTPSA